MATISSSQTLDSAARTAGEAMTITSGATLTIDTDTRYHKNAPASGTGSLGSFTMTAATGGTVLVEGRNVRWLAFVSGSGTVPAYDTDITGGTSGATGKLLGVYTAVNAAPTAVGAAMPATGFIKLKSASAAFNASESLTGITATTNGTDVTGWIEVVLDDAANITIGRAQTFRVRGEWFELGTTTGSANQVVQLPTCGGGTNTLYAGVWIETSSGSGTYEFWPAQYYTAALTSGWYSTAKGTDARSKFVEMQTGGAIRIGQNASGAYGYTPSSGCKIRIPNVLLVSCATASRASNSVPNATATTRPKFTTSSAGSIDIDGCLTHWYFNVNQAYAFSLKNAGVIDNLAISEVATAVVMENVGTGNYLNTDVDNVTLTSCLAGGTITGCKFGRCGTMAANDRSLYLSFCKDFTLTDCFFENRIFRTAAGAYPLYIASCDAISVIRPIVVGHGIGVATATNTYIEDLVYADSYHTTSSATAAVAGAISLLSGSVDTVIKGGSFWPGISDMHPDGAFLTLQGATNTRWHSCGTPSTPLSGGTSNQMLYMLNDAASNLNIEVKRVYGTNIATRFVISGNSTRGLILENCADDYAKTNTSFDALDGLIKGFAVSAADNAFTSVYGTMFYNIFTSATVGRVGITMNEETSTYAPYITKTGLTGASGFDSTGLLYLYNLNDEVVWEFPYTILGYTAFAASDAQKGGTGTANIGIEYQLDSGSGWGSWTSATSANLSAESIDPQDGFRLRLKAKCTTAGTNSLNSLYLSMTTTTSDQAELYPLDVATITLSGFDIGTRIQIYDLDDDVELYNDVPAADPLEYDVEYIADKNIRVRAMYATDTTANIFVEFSDVLRVSGLSRTIDTVVDDVYVTNGIDGSSVTDITIDDSALLVNIDTGSVSYATIYAYETYWLTTATGIRDEGRFIEAVDPTNYIFTDFKIKNVTSPSVPLELTGGYARDSVTLTAIELIDNTGGTIFCAPDHVVAYESGGGGLTAAGVWSYSTRKLTGTKQSFDDLNDVTAQDVREEIDANSTKLADIEVFSLK